MKGAKDMDSRFQAKNHSDTKFLVQYRDNITSRAGKFNLKTNEFFEIYTYIYGEGPYFYFANDRIYTIEPGSILILRPGVLVGSCKRNKARYTRLVCKIPTHMMDFICEMNSACADLLFDSDVSIVNLSGSPKEEYFSYVEKLRELSALGSKHRDTLMFSVLLQMLVILCKNYSSQDGSITSSSSNELILPVLASV